MTLEFYKDLWNREVRVGTLLPAYGRDYKSKKAALADLKSGKDFVFRSFDSGDRYVNLEQLPAGTYHLRYCRLTRVLVLRCDGKGQVV